MYEEKFHKLSRAGLRLDEVFACSKYVDDCNADSLLACTKCSVEFVKGTYRASFDEAEPNKFLDMHKSYTHSSRNRKPRIVLRPAIKNMKKEQRRH